LLAITFGLGAITAISVPAWQAILPQLVPRASLAPAVALHAVGINLSRAIGPALGGALIVAVGMASPFFVNALSFLAIILALWKWRPPAAAPLDSSGESLVASMGTGIAHAFGNLFLRNVLLRSVAFYIFGSAYWALLPLIAREQLSGDARLFGVLVGCIGAGGVAGALWLPRLRQRFGLDGALVIGTVGTALALTGFALLRVPALGLACGVLAGSAWIAALSSLNVAAQLAVQDAFRARGMALYSSVFYGCLAAGSMAWGQVATHLALTPALLLAAAGAMLALPLARWWPVASRTSAG
jgi:predicted MFS family arabinose efflux permease